LKGKIFKEYFYFTRAERSGIVILFIIILLLITIKIILPYLIKNEIKINSGFENEVKKFIDYSIRSDSLSKFNKDDKIKKYNFHFKSFNPNLITAKDLTDFGLPDNLIKNWIKYITKGGHFNSVSDVKKLWGMTDSIFFKLEPYIIITEKIKSNSQIINKKNFFPVQITRYNNNDNSVELNSADSSVLCDLPGIGPGFSKRIMKYRDKLGGYANKIQLLEVYGFTPEMYAKVEGRLFVNSDIIRKINVNTSDFKVMIKHPYFTKDVVIRILEYRKIQGKISNIDELYKVKLLEKQVVEKLIPYIQY
jgi:competence protein ComEA